MREPRRNHYIAPVANDETVVALDDAIDTLRRTRSFQPDDPGVTLHLLASIITETQQRLPEAVANARDHGYSWAEIAELLGVTRASAWQRYADHTNPRP